MRTIGEIYQEVKFVQSSNGRLHRWRLRSVPVRIHVLHLGIVYLLRRRYLRARLIGRGGQQLTRIEDRRRRWRLRWRLHSLWLIVRHVLIEQLLLLLRHLLGFQLWRWSELSTGLGDETAWWTVMKRRTARVVFELGQAFGLSSSVSVHEQTCRRDQLTTHHRLLVSLVDTRVVVVFLVQPKMADGRYTGDGRRRWSRR